MIHSGSISWSEIFFDFGFFGYILLTLIILIPTSIFLLAVAAFGLKKTIVPTISGILVICLFYVPLLFTEKSSVFMYATMFTFVSAIILTIWQKKCTLNIPLHMHPLMLSLTNVLLIGSLYAHSDLWTGTAESLFVWSFLYLATSVSGLYTVVFQIVQGCSVLLNKVTLTSFARA